MSEDMVLSILRETVQTGLKISAPFLIVSIVVGLVISIFRATTQIQEQTLTFVPKLIAIAAVGLLAGSWIIQTMVSFTQNIFTLISNIVH